MKNILVILAILVLLIELYHLLRGYWLRCLLEKKKGAKRPRKPVVLRPKSERDYPYCQGGPEKHASVKLKMPIAWRERKGRGGLKKRISTAGYFCPNEACEYYGITEEHIHALVGYGTHGKQEMIQDLKCQACGKKCTARRNPIRSRLKRHSGWVEKILWEWTHPR